MHMNIPGEQPSHSETVDEGVTYREEVLKKAASLVSGDRNVDYDEPSRNFEIIADLWQTYLGVSITRYDVAVLNILQKVSRIMSSPSKEDHWVDIAGYAACGYEAHRHEYEAHRHEMNINKMLF